MLYLRSKLERELGAGLDELGAFAAASSISPSSATTTRSRWP